MKTNLLFLWPSARVPYRSLLLFVVVLCAAVYVCGQGDTTPPPSGMPVSPSASPSLAGEDYIISPDDVLDVYTVDVAEMSRSIRVSPSGTVSLPLLGKPLPAAGLTLLQLADSIEEALRASGVVVNAQVTVSVQQSRLHSVAVTGAVRRPQIYPVFGRTTLLDVISQSEGLADDAGNIAIVRRGDIAVRTLGLNPKDNGVMTVRADLRKALEESDATSNVEIYPGDRVTIPRAGIVYIVGAVNRPGGYAIRPNGRGMTVMQAVALAEDVKPTAKRDQAMIVRVSASDPEGRIQIPVDLKKILAGKGSDPVLQAEDILFVPDSTGKKAVRRSLETALQLTTGIAIYSARF